MSEDEQDALQVFMGKISKAIMSASGIPSIYLTPTVDSTAVTIDDSVKALPAPSEVKE